MPSWMKWAVSLILGFGFIVLGWRLADSRWFGWLLPTFFVVNCLFLIIVVLLQSGKAADIAGAFGGAGSQTAFGPRGAATVLSRATTWCAIMFMVCAMALVLRTNRGVEAGGSSVFEKVGTPKSAPKPAPTAPAKPQGATPQTPNPQSGTPAQSPQSGTPAAPPTNNAPATPPPAQQPPANSQPAPAKKP